MNLHEKLAQLHEEIAAVHRLMAKAEDARPERKEWMTLREFAVYSGKGESTVRKHIADGMPCERIPHIRIQPERAMAWLSAYRPLPKLRIVQVDR